MSFLTKPILAAAAAAMALLPATAAHAVQNGGVSGSTAQRALPNAVSFDPPAQFSQSLPLKGFYVNPQTKINFTGGNGGLLNSSGNFGVTGFSAPNFLAFNCELRNADGTTPALPMRATFSAPVSHVSMKVGTSMGGIATLVGLSSGGVVLATASVTLTGALQTLQIALPSASVKKIVLRGPCVMVVDDISAS